MAFETDPLVTRMVRVLAEPRSHENPEKDLDLLVSGLCVVAMEQRWYCVMQICLPFITDAPPEIQDSIPNTDDEQLAQFLAFGHRINEALYLRLHGREAVAERLRGLRLPSRLWNLPRTDRWISMETVRDTLSDIRARTRRLPKWGRHAWATQALRKRFATLNTRMLAATDMGLLRHMMATGRQWIRLTKASEHDAIHIRIHYASGIMSVRLRSQGIARTKRTILPLLVGQMLSDEERPHIDRHFALSFISMKVFETLWRLHANTEIEALMAHLQFFYGIILGDLLSDPAVETRIAAMGEYPTLVVTSHGAFAQLPFAALHDGERHLVERFNVVQASPLFSDREFNEGDIDYETVVGGTPTSITSLRVLAGGEHLRHVEQELIDLKAIGGSGEIAVEVGPPDSMLPWTEKTLQWLLGSNGAALLSAHMKSSISRASEAVVVTPDGRELAVGDILSASITARLVMLSGCISSGYTDWLPPGENSVVSLLRRAGAESVVSTLWPISDYAARVYNVAFVSALAKGASRVAAHGAAQRSIMGKSITAGQAISYERLARRSGKLRDESRDLLSMKNPGYWAAFTLTGSWR